MAYVLVQHFDPTHESALPEILQRITHIPIHEITEDIQLAPNHIYIIPPNKILISTNGALKLTPRDEKKLNLPIDPFLHLSLKSIKSMAVLILHKIQNRRRIMGCLKVQ
jgi:two-component system CheB/CheR fusion protein